MSQADLSKASKQSSIRKYVILFFSILPIVWFPIHLYLNSLPTNFKRGPFDTSTGIVSKLTMAEGVTGANDDPVNPTHLFKVNQTIHAIVSTNNAPAGTVFALNWFQDTNGHLNTIYRQELTSGGTHNLDFTLTQSLSPGSYGVSVFTGPSTAAAVNLEDLQDFTVQ